MSGTKRFRVLLEKHSGSEATAIYVPFDVLKVFGTRARIPVCGTINGTPFRSSIMPMGGRHMMLVPKKLREAARVKGGDRVSVHMQRDEAPRTVTPPQDFARALKANKEALAMWDKLSYTHRREHVQAIEEAVRPETRARRINKAIEQLADGKKP